MRTSSSNASFGSKIACDLVAALGEAPDREEVLCRCPICGDSKTDPNKRRFSVNLIKCKFHCFNCLANGSATEMAEILLNLGTMLSSQHHKPICPKKRVIDFKPLMVKVGRLPDARKKIILDDLLPRAVYDEETILGLDYCLTGSRPKKWVNRVVIEVDGVKFGKAHDGSLPKYLTEPNFRLVRHGYINKSNVTLDGKPAILTEGLLDLLSLPPDRAMMSPGTSGLFNDMLVKTSYEVPLIEVPDSDNAGVMAFLRIINKGLLDDPHARVKFFFVYWVTGNLDDDINDLLKSGLTKEDIYHSIVDRALPFLTTLDKLRKSFDIIKTKKGYELREEVEKRAQVKASNNKRFDPNGPKRPVKDENKRSKRKSTPEKGRSRKNNDNLSWF